MKVIHENNVEEFVLDILKKMDYKILHGSDEQYLPGGASALRDDYKTVVLIPRLRDALHKINPNVQDSAIEHAIKRVLRSSSQNVLEDNEDFHHMLTDGIDVPVRDGDGERHEKVWLFDSNNTDKNDFVAMNQFTILGHDERRPDIVLFINGIPLLVFELKNLADENADIWSAYEQLQTYKKQMPLLFRYNEILVISDGTSARAGTITSPKIWFKQWKTIHDTEPKEPLPEIEVLLRGMCQKEILLDLMQNFIIFEKEKQTAKKMAQYHQYGAVNKAIRSTLHARNTDKRAGIMWHAPGSGKSLIMVFYAAKLVREMDNPTIVVLTDRNDLDGQLFENFARCADILRQTPRQAERRSDLDGLLKVSSGGIVFTTIQKFVPEESTHPVLSKRDNIVIIADEAHRSHYGFEAKINKDGKKTYGYAKYLREALPNASRIGFTGTPIEMADKSTEAVFGAFIDTYDDVQSVNDGATVPIYYASRLVKIKLDEDKKSDINKTFESITEEQEKDERENLKSRWSQMEKLVGSQDRICTIADDIIQHYEDRTSIVPGKAMIVCMSRRICVDLYNAIIQKRSEWQGKQDEEGKIKIVMTGSASDPVEWQPHIRSKARRKKIGDAFKDPVNQLQILIVRDMFLTGFDAPSCHTMYIDKPMSGHNLQQTISRVNRVFTGKKDALIVDYVGFFEDLMHVRAVYGKRGRKTTVDVVDEAKKVLVEKYEIVSDMFHGFDYKGFFKLDNTEKIRFFPRAIEHIMSESGRQESFEREVAALLRAYALCKADVKVDQYRDDIGLFQAIKASIVKTTSSGSTTSGEVDTAIKQIITESIKLDEIINIFDVAGMDKPNLSLLSDEFLDNIKQIEEKNYAIEALKKLLNNDIRTYRRKNIVRGGDFVKMLEDTIKKYTNKSITSAQVIEKLVELAKQFKKERERGKILKLTEDELAFYDALEVNDSAVSIMGDDVLRTIALELTNMIRKNVTIDWMNRESVRAAIRLHVKKILKKYGYPPDKQKTAASTVLTQAEVIAKDWAK